MQEKRFVEDIRIGDKAHIVTVADAVGAVDVFNILDIENRSSTWSNIIACGSACVCFVNRANFLVHIEDKEAVCLLVHEHNVILVAKEAILTVGVWDPLESFCEFLLCKVDKKLSFVLLIQVFLLHVLCHVEVFGPVADSGCVREFRST